MNIATPGQIAVYRVALGFVGIIDVLWLIFYRFHKSGHGDCFILPLIDGLRLPPVLHEWAFGVALALAVFIILDVFTPLSAFCFSAFMLYVETSDYFAFHHSIFLSANLFGLLGCMTLPWRGQFPLRDFGITGTKILICAVYFFAGINKVTEGFLAGSVLTQMIGNNNLGATILSWLPWIPAPMSIGSALVELALPILLLTRLRVGFVVGICLHLGIGVIGQAGLTFNAYIPVTYIIFMLFTQRNECVILFARSDDGYRVFLPAGSVLLNPLSLMIAAYCFWVLSVIGVSRSSVFCIAAAVVVAITCRWLTLPRSKTP